MRKLGSVSQIAPARNQEMTQTLRAIAGSSESLSSEEIFIRLVNSPSSRFWVSEERAAEILGRMFRGDPLKGMRPHRREMFQALFRIASEYLADNPGASYTDAAFHAVHTPAPKFFITPGSARTIFSHMRRMRSSNSSNSSPRYGHSS